LLYAAAATWIAAGMAWYAYAFIRDFYAANQHAIAKAIEMIR